MSWLMLLLCALTDEPGEKLASPPSSVGAWWVVRALSSYVMNTSCDELGSSPYSPVPPWNGILICLNAVNHSRYGLPRRGPASSAPAERKEKQK
jgi:hypothetical protein